MAVSGAWLTMVRICPVQSRSFQDTLSGWRLGLSFMNVRTRSAVTSVTVLPFSSLWTSSELPHETFPK